MWLCGGDVRAQQESGTKEQHVSGLLNINQGVH